MRTVNDLMTRDPVLVRERDPAATAAELMRTRKIRHLPVVRRGRLVGVVTASDLQVQAGGTVSDAMTPDVTSVTSGTGLHSAIELMLARKLSCLPVIGPDATVVGILTAADVLRFAREHVADLDFREYAATYDD